MNACNIDYVQKIRGDTKIEKNPLNLCLGLQSRKNLVKETILYEKIDILRLQETEINKNLDHNLLSFPSFGIESENNTDMARVTFNTQEDLGPIL